MNKRIQCDWEISGTINYGMQQNHVAVVRSIVVTNSTNEDLSGITVQISAEPLFAHEWTKSFDLLPAGKALDTGAVPLQMSSSMLSELTERIAGTLKLTIRQDEVILFEDFKPIEILAFDEWGGLTILPELIAAFVTPNHPLISKVVTEAAGILKQWSGSPSFNAYQSKDPNRVNMQAAALYTALQNYQISYIVAPPSFENIGQRVRLPDTIFTNKMGNCLDLSLLYAACAEAVGLHPLLIFTEGHAFTGVWLVEETFSESVQDDVSLLTKRVATGINEICLIESTTFVAGQLISFDDSIKLAENHLVDVEKFECIVDVRRARFSSIRPLPLRVAIINGLEIQANTQEVVVAAIGPERLDTTIIPLETATIPITKHKQWERRLLDLTLRNGLLNFRLTKSSVPIMSVQLSELEDALSEREEFQVIAKPEDWQDDTRSAELFQSVGGTHPFAPLLRGEFERKRLRANLSALELEMRLVHLYRTSRVSLEENGANTLYLSLGLLKWYETDISEMPRYAPLVLVPVEILRKSSRQGYVIRMRDEEPQMNITLLEMLRQDFGIDIGGLDPLPKDEQGIDLKLVFAIIRRAVMQRSRWDIEEVSCLGLFSFGQFVMWNDIRTRTAELASNKIVASLMEGRLQWTQEMDVHLELDKESPSQLFVPISADSTQLEAVRAASQDQSFVLHGPPGTGKSQTITNMIANALASGKRVLFVAEKMAALSVVQRRLANIGLDPFCLELHSNKSSKKAVLEQLNVAMNVAKLQSSDQWSAQGERLASLRSELNGYVDALHQPYSFGFSLYEAIAGFEKAGEGQDAVVFEDRTIESLTEDQVTTWRDLVTQVKAAGEACGGPHGNPWSNVHRSSYSQTMRTDVETLVNSYRDGLLPVHETFLKASKRMGLGWEPVSRDKNGMFIQLCELMINVPDVTSKLIQSTDLESSIRDVRAVAEQGRRRDTIRDSVCTHFHPDIYRIDVQMTLAEWNRLELKWVLPKWSGQNRIYKLMRSMLASGQEISKKQVPSMLNQVIQWHEEDQKLKVAIEKISHMLGSRLWNDQSQEWEAIDAACDWIMKLQELLSSLFDHESENIRTRHQLGMLLIDGASIFQTKFASMLEQVVKQYVSHVMNEQALLQLLEVNDIELDQEIGTENAFIFMHTKSAGWQNHLNELRDWCAWRRVRNEVADAGLLPLLLPLEVGHLTVELVLQSFDRGLYKACANHIIAKDVRLGQFSGRLFEEKIDRFAEIDRRYEELTRLEIHARLAAKVPVMMQEAAQSSEAGILQRAVRSGGRGLSIRKLFESIPNLLPRLSPCMLMSPISVAQYLDPLSPKFDLVIFDEASQVPTSQAVGALARGHHAVIVGDPKQLPPTSFFSKMNLSSDEDEMSVEDLESILDDCLALGMSQKHLSWHYRSRHESLIAFSNAHYYDNKLMTFPSPEAPVSSVKWYPVEGFYDRGRTKKNQAEGEAVIAEIVRRLMDEDLRKQSIGVVTFSSIQQSLIEDLLDDKFREYPELESLQSSLPEPIFIKNLENVQGDERDVILFSIGYGPDSLGKVSLNFGPLNREGGWRRLNVAVSRARHEMIVFSTLQSGQLNASRTSSQGVMGLKSFLEYAEKGSRVLPIVEPKHRLKLNVDLHRGIAAELLKHGYQTDINVGTSGYRIDLAIKDPLHPGKYLLGLILDGPIYREAKTVRDREVLREQVLKGLGWNIHHVWALDWWDNTETVIRKIEQVIELARTKQIHPIEELQPMMLATSTSESSIEGVAASESQQKNDENSRDFATLTSGLPEGTLRYEVCELTQVTAGTDAFYALEHTATIRDQILKVIQEEGPISRSLLVKRVLKAWGITRMGARLDRRITESMSNLKVHTTEWDAMIYCWPIEIDVKKYDMFRLSMDDTQRRTAEELPPEEVANAIRYVLRSQISLTLEDLIKQSIKVLGYARTGAALEKTMMNGLTSAVERQYAMVDEQGRVVIKN